MKRIILPACILILVNVFAQKKISMQKGNEEAVLSAINHQFIRNFLNNDTVEHNKIIHPGDFLFIGTDGKFADRKTYMEEWAHGYNKETVHDFVMEDERIRVFGDMAVIIAKTHFETMKNGEWVVGEIRYSDTYIKENGNWRCIHVQLTKLAVPEHL